VLPSNLASHAVCLSILKIAKIELTKLSAIQVTIATNYNWLPSLVAKVG